VDPALLAGGIAVVIDQFRASTTMCAALANGATGVVPCVSEEEAAAKRAAAPVGTVLAGGEREGRLIPGFDLDNSPTAYTRERVAGKTIAFTTTNGTKAAVLAEKADVLVIGCLANVAALVKFIGVDERVVHVICAGTRQRVTLEDSLAAGAIGEALMNAGRPVQMSDARPDDDSTMMMIDLWRGALVRGLGGELKRSRGARNLMREGLNGDIEACSVVDGIPVVPVMDRGSGAFVLG
jgi:2-phosphosulfolactate phosphatase